jgi:hypothetical protein
VFNSRRFPLWPSKRIRFKISKRNINTILSKRKRNWKQKRRRR